MLSDKIIYINKDEYEVLLNSISNFIKVIYSFEIVDSAYITCYSSDCSNGSLRITVILNDEIQNETLKTLIDGINSAYKLNSVKNTGVLFSFDNVNNFNIDSHNAINKIRLEELLLSDILFDKSGFISNIKNANFDYHFNYLLNTANFTPPINKELVKILNS